MKPPAFIPIRDKIERAYRNDGRLHLDPDLVRRLVHSPVWAKIAELAAQEKAESWQNELLEDLPRPATTTPPASSSAHSGSGSAPSAMNGASAGMMKGPLAAAVERAERGQAWEAVSQVGRRKRRRTP